MVWLHNKSDFVQMNMKFFIIIRLYCCAAFVSRNDMQKKTRLCISTYKEKNKKRRYREKIKAYTDKQTFEHVSEMQVRTTALNYTKCAGPFFKAKVHFFPFAK